MRAVAVMLVLVFHFSLPIGVNAGFLGVDIFFVISGFLITSILKSQIEAKTFRLSTFYVDRIRRLAPTLSLVLVLTMIVAAAWLLPQELRDFSRQVLAAQFYVANIYYWRTINYFAEMQSFPLLHTWSLAIEAQFYLLYPICVIFLLRYLRRQFWPAILLLAVVSFWLNIVIVGDRPQAAFYLPPARAWELLMGALVLPLAAGWARNRYADEAIALIGAVLILVGVTCYRADHVPGYYTLLPTVGTAFLLLSGQSGATRFSKFLSLKPIVYTGKISYAAYLVHWPVQNFASQMIDDYSLTWRISMFALSVVLAAIVHQAFENPLRRQRIAFNDNALLTGYVGATFVMILLVGVVNTSNGLPGRFPTEVVRLAGYADDTTAPLAECQSLDRTEMRVPASCHIGSAGQTPVWLVYGDSHAWAAHAAFDKWLTARGQGGILLFHHNCPPLTGIRRRVKDDDCFAFNESITRFIELNPRLRYVALVSAWYWPTDGGLLSPSLTPLSKDESIRLFTERFSQTLQHLHNLGRRVYVWEPVPGARRFVPSELARLALERRAGNIEVDMTEYLSKNRLFFAALEKSHPWFTDSFSPSKTLCSTGKCIVEEAGRPLYFDSQHMSKSTADFWIRVLEKTPISD